jgi:hypothetical protein
LVFYPRTPCMTSRKADFVLAAVWAVPGVLFVPWLFVYQQQTFNVHGYEYVACNANWQSHNLHVAFTVGVVFVTCYLVPFVIIAILYMLIGCKVKRRV